MADAIAKAAAVPPDRVRRALMLSGDLPRDGGRSRSGAAAEDCAEVGLELFRPILPMLASTATSVADAVASFDRASVEWKLDGIRIQIHRRGDEVRIYTRNLNEITSVLPGIVAAVRALPVRQAVFDGEALWMSEDGPAAFQETVSQIDRDAPPDGIETFLFDLLHLDGDDLLDTPLAERSARLRRDRAEARDSRPPHLRRRRGAARARRVARAPATRASSSRTPTSLYAAGRRGKAWLKVKPVRTYDLVVLGAEWGHGRRQGWLSNLHLGARDPATGGFVMVGKMLQGPDRRAADAGRPRSCSRARPAAVGSPCSSRPELVVEIALDGVQSSTRYPGGVALRFARVKRYRPDKNADRGRHDRRSPGVAHNSNLTAHAFRSS